jgi:predicted sulfurtransferase
MKARLVRRVTGIIGAAVLCMVAQLALAAEVPRMTKEELKPKLDNPDVVIVDVRVGKDWKGSEFKIKGAVRENPSEFSSWAEKYPKDKTIVLYCA